MEHESSTLVFYYYPAADHLGRKTAQWHTNCQLNGDDSISDHDEVTRFRTILNGGDLKETWPYYSPKEYEAAPDEVHCTDRAKNARDAVSYQTFRLSSVVAQLKRDMKEVEENILSGQENDPMEDNDNKLKFKRSEISERLIVVSRYLGGLLEVAHLPTVSFQRESFKYQAEVKGWIDKLEELQHATESCDNSIQGKPTMSEKQKSLELRTRCLISRGKDQYESSRYGDFVAYIEWATVNQELVDVAETIRDMSAEWFVSQANEPEFVLQVGKADGLPTETEKEEAYTKYRSAREEIIQATQENPELFPDGDNYFEFSQDYQEVKTAWETLRRTKKRRDQRKRHKQKCLSGFTHTAAQTSSPLTSPGNLVGDTAHDVPSVLPQTESSHNVTEAKTNEGEYSLTTRPDKMVQNLPNTSVTTDRLSEPVQLNQVIRSENNMDLNTDDSAAKSSSVRSTEKQDTPVVGGSHSPDPVPITRDDEDVRDTAGDVHLRSCTDLIVPSRRWTTPELNTPFSHSHSEKHQ
ncbi:hypothetical protein M231_02873 [Tremella mesenterica]|uniref:Uncharacterized protein n=1 Tax=Tremella mesenterica TaxID=5217 RepID=A0A4Q1BPI7_TREME|nr:hypothetical protein M231_02873 [Tremella mesenterica]